MSKLPAGLASAEVQLWLNAEFLDFESIGKAAAEAPTEAPTETPSVGGPTEAPTDEPTQGPTSGAQVTLSGDANEDGKITVSDAVAILQFIANQSKYPLSNTGMANADCDGELGITGGDAIAVQKADAGIVTLPITK